MEVASARKLKELVKFEKKHVFIGTRELRRLSSPHPLGTLDNGKFYEQKNFHHYSDLISPLWASLQSRSAICALMWRTLSIGILLTASCLRDTWVGAPASCSLVSTRRQTKQLKHAPVSVYSEINVHIVYISFSHALYQPWNNLIGVENYIILLLSNF